MPTKTKEELFKEENAIRVIGVDNKQHMAYPWDTVCLCGVRIKRKKLLSCDYKLYSCYECTY